MSPSNKGRAGVRSWLSRVVASLAARDLYSLAVLPLAGSSAFAHAA